MKLGYTMQRNEWQPISTAPRDTPVLLFCPDKYGDMMTVTKLTQNRYYDPYWDLVEIGSYTNNGDLDTAPTHWMPLPLPPQ